MNTMNSDTSLFSSNFPYYIEGRNAYLDASVWVNDYSLNTTDLFKNLGSFRNKTNDSL